MNIILCGLPKCGKSTVGKALAKRLQWPFIDTDSGIEEAYAASTGKKCSCREIFIQEGERFFRELETQQINALETTRVVISLGGGALCDPVNESVLKSLGRIVYLKVPSHTVLKRIAAHGPPAFMDTPFLELVQHRTPAYEKAADCIVETKGMTVSQIVNFLVEWSNKHGE